MTTTPTQRIVMQDALNEAQYDGGAYYAACEKADISRETADEFRDDAMMRIGISSINNGSCLAVWWIVVAAPVIWAMVEILNWVAQPLMEKIAVTFGG